MVKDLAAFDINVGAFAKAAPVRTGGANEMAPEKVPTCK
jgi:hypothetical protein